MFLKKEEMIMFVIGLNKCDLCLLMILRGAGR